jgi:hypothetical protein
LADADSGQILRVRQRAPLAMSPTPSRMLDRADMRRGDRAAEGCDAGARTTQA